MGWSYFYKKIFQHGPNFVNDYYDVLKYILDTTSSPESTAICENLFCEYLTDNYGKYEAERTYTLLCVINDSFHALLKTIKHDGERGRQKIYEDSICPHLPDLKEMPNENQSSNAELRRSISNLIRDSKILTDVGLNSIHIHISEFESGCISAERVGLSKNENKERSERLRKSLRNSPYHFIEVQGVFVVDKGSKDWKEIEILKLKQDATFRMMNKTTIKETLFFVFDFGNAGGLMKFLKTKMEIYYQENFLFMEPSRYAMNPITKATLYKTDGQKHRIGRKIKVDIYRRGGGRDMINALMKGKVQYSTRAKPVRYFVVQEFADREKARYELIMEKALEYGVI